MGSADIVRANGLYHKSPEALEVSDMMDGDYEEITSEEVDRVVAALEILGESVASETIKSLLETCSSEIYYLVYEDEEMGEAA